MDYLAVGCYAVIGHVGVSPVQMTSAEATGKRLGRPRKTSKDQESFAGRDLGASMHF